MVHDGGVEELGSAADTVAVMPDPLDISPIVLPAESDPMLIGATDRLGGHLGTRASVSRRFWTPIRILIILTSTAFTLGYISKLPCHAESFGGDARYTRLCYSDIPFLYQLRGFADGWLPYIDTGTGRGPALEYPVLTGVFMQVGSWLTGRSGSASERALVFYDWNVLLLLICLIVAVVCTALTVRRRPWDAALVALAPGTILCAVINWDLLAVAFTAASMLMWSRKRPGWSGILLGLAIASKFYPLFLLGPLFLLCLRAGRLRSFATLVATAAASWLAVNIPFILINFDGWKEFYTFSATRGADWGSLWYVFMALKHPIPADLLNVVVAICLITLCIGIALVILRSERRPRYAQVAFLVIAAFCITNKVYSPQYVLWLIPLAAMARPRWRDFLIWQITQVIYFASIWYFLQQYGNDNKGLPEGWYVAAILVLILGTCWFAGMVIRDIVRPQHDPIRTDGYDEHRDDPGGGVLDFAEDVVTLRR
jgi:uncharacterized membrane protein